MPFDQMIATTCTNIVRVDLIMAIYLFNAGHLGLGNFYGLSMVPGFKKIEKARVRSFLHL